MFGAGSKALTSYLGITQAKLQSIRASGKSLAEICEGERKAPPPGLVAALVAATKSQLDKAVAAKHLTAEQEKADSGQDAVLHQKFRHRQDVRFFGHGMHFGHGFGGRASGHGFGHGGGMFGAGPAGGMFGAGSKALTSYLRDHEAKLQSDLASGKSLAQIAKANGKTTAGLVAASSRPPRASWTRPSLRST